MADIFAITTASEDNIKVNESGSTIIMFTATNKTGNPVRGVAKIKPIDNTQSDWLTIEGETERDFSANGTQQFTVNFNKPASEETQEAQNFPFRLDVISSANPDEDFTEGPTVTVGIDEKKAEEKKPFPIWIPIVAGVLLLVIIGGVVGYLLTRDSSIKVPDVVGKTVEEAKTELEGLDLKVKEEYKRTSRAESGKVLAQEPPKDTEVEAGATIILTVPIKKIVLPNLVNKNIKDAEKELKALGLKSETVYVKASGKVDDVVFNQSPSDGSEVEPESIVKLSVPLKKVKVSNVIGFSLNNAKAELEEKGLKVKQLYKSSLLTKNVDAVLDQNPKGNNEVESGTVVTLYFPMERVKLPNVKTMKYAEARSDLLALKLKVQKLYHSAETTAPDTVVSQDPIPKKVVEIGTAVKLYVPKRRVKLANYKGKIFTIVSPQLISQGLLVKKVPIHTPNTALKGRIVNHSPVAGKEVEVGKTVTFYVWF